MENHGLVKLVTLGMAAAITDHEEEQTQEDGQMTLEIGACRAAVQYQRLFN